MRKFTIMIRPATAGAMRDARWGGAARVSRTCAPVATATANSAQQP